MPATELKADSPSRIKEEEETEADLSELHMVENPESTAHILLEEEEEVLYTLDGDVNKHQQGGANIPQGEEGQVLCELNCHEDGQHKLNGASAGATTQRFDRNENEIPKRRSYSASNVIIHDNHDPKTKDGAKESLPNGQPNSDSEPEVKHQEAAESVGDKVRSSLNFSKLLNSVNGSISSKLYQLKESLIGQTKQESDAKSDKVEANSSYNLGYITGVLSEAYKDTGRRLQGTREIIQNIQVGEMKFMLFQYVTKMSQELPVYHKIQPKLEPEPCVTTENKVQLVDASKDCAFSVAQSCSMSSIPGVSGWPEGSVSSVKNTCPEVFHQRLVLLPPALSQLESLSSDKLLEKLESLVPQLKVVKLSSIFWVKTASRKQTIPKPACLLLSETAMVALSSQTNSNDTPAVFHRFNLGDITEIQISLGGQHVRLIGCTEDNVLAVFTHSKELTQEFCKALLRAHCPDRFSEAIEDQPLLSGDLMALSLDWKSVVPDIVLDSGLQITSRFKRVLADLLYIIHGNMNGPGKPSLGNILPLLYSSVKIMNSTHPGDIVQFLLTDTHIALLREDGVFHPVPRGSSVVPAQPQFKGVELRSRSEIRCLFVKKKDDCLVVDITFTTPQRQTGEKPVRPRRGSLDTSSVSHHRHQNDSWKLTFGCTSEAVMLINHLCH